MLQKMTSWLLYLLIGVAIVSAALLYAGGFENAPTNTIPVYTDQILFLTYIFVGIAVAATVAVSLVNFIQSVRLEPQQALKKLIGPVVIVALVFVAYLMADGTPLKIIGYDGNDNIPSMLKFADVCLYTTYFLLVISMVLVVATSVIKVFK